MCCEENEGQQYQDEIIMQQFSNIKDCFYVEKFHITAYHNTGMEI